MICVFDLCHRLDIKVKTRLKSGVEIARALWSCDGIASLGRIRWCNVIAASGVVVICKFRTGNFVKQY